MEIFISYSFVGRDGNQYYSGFGHTILKRPSLPKNEEDIEYLQGVLNSHAEKKHGMDSVITTILWYNELK